MEPNTTQDTIKKSTGKKKKWILGGLIVLIVLGLFGASMANDLIARLAPDKYVMLSLLEMQKTADKDLKSKKTPRLKEQKNSLSFNIKQIDGLNDDHTKGIIEGLGTSMTVATNEDGHIKIDAGFNTNGLNLMDISLYSENHEIGIKIPGLLSQYVMLDLDAFKEKYDQSDLAYFMGPIEQEAVDMVKDSINQYRSNIMGDVQNTHMELTAAYQEVFTDFIKNAAVKYDGTSKVSVGGKNKKANQFTITMDSNHIKSFVKDLTRATLRNKQVQKNIQTLLELDGYYSFHEWEDMIYEGLDQLKFSDIELNCAIDHKKRILRTDLLTAFNIDGERVKVNGHYNVSGEDSLLDQLEASLTLQSDHDKMQIDLERDKSFLGKKTNTSDDIRFRIRLDGEQMLTASLNIEQDLDVKDDNYYLSAKVAIPDEDIAIKFNLSGDLVTGPNPMEMSLDASKVALTLTSSGETAGITASGRFAIEDLAGESITISKDQKLDLFSIDQRQLFDIINRIGNEFYEIGRMLDSVL